jgi:hypothetical protein
LLYSNRGVCRGKASQRSRCKSGPRRCRYILVATREMARVTGPSKPRGQRPAFQGGSASVRAATRVKPEQASKGVMRAPSLLTEDEGRRGRPDASTCEGRPARRGMGRSTYAHAMTCNTGDLFGLPGRLGERLLGRRVQQESQGPIRPMNPGNAGGGKGPWFGVRSNEPREGDWREPGNS